VVIIINNKIIDKKMEKKAIIFDSGTLINLSMNGLLDILRELKKIFNGKFIITEDVKYETFGRPVKIKKFELGALRIKQLIDDKILEMLSSFNISHQEIEAEIRRFLDISNKTFYARNEYIRLIDRGEASCLAVSKILSERGIKNVISIDERTTRMLGEKPENLHRLLESKLHTKIEANRNNYKFFKDFKFIRSSELLYIAYKKRLINLKNGEVLDALLFAAKFKGCAISYEEIQEMKRM